MRDGYQPKPLVASPDHLLLDLADPRCIELLLELRLEELARNGDFAAARYSVVREP